MQSITPSEKFKPIKKDAPKKCIDFVLNYSKSYHVIAIGELKVGLTMN